MKLKSVPCQRSELMTVDLIEGSWTGYVVRTYVYIYSYHPRREEKGEETQIKVHNLKQFQA